jgi:hypothetical protein
MVCGCGLFPEAVTVPGPESNSLLPKTNGFVVMAQACGGMVAVELPTLRETVIRRQSSVESDDMPTIHAMSGPDDQGRIAYIEDHVFARHDKDQRHLLKTIHLDGSGDTALFSRPGDAMWAETVIGHGKIGKAFSLSRTGGKVAFLSGTHEHQMPQALLMEGSVEIWDINKKTGTKTDLVALDAGLTWLPDGKHLVYVKLIDRKPTGPADPITASYLQWNWDKIPAVFIRDLETQTDTLVHTGWNPLVSVDGSKVLTYGFAGCGYYCVELGSGKIFPLTGPGSGRPVAMLDDTTLLAECYPTQATKVKFHGAWPIHGPREVLALKLTRTDSNTFQTVIQYLDATNIDYGLGPRQP